jgi:class 3 adenylate cyclase/predicted ATPase
MQCPRCQHENREGRRFCAECAAPLAVPCQSCGFSNEPGEKFCGGCAAPLTVASRPPESKFTSPQSYTPKHLAEKILTSKSALEGERKQVTVLFADLKGSTELLADRDPEEARKLLDPVLERMMEAVHRYEGTVNQVMGDGIMALFGAPLAHEDHAVRACYAAIRMQESVKRHAEGVRREHGVTIRIRVGLNSGEVVVRAIGSDLHMDYTAVGQTTHLAARMEQLADPGTILLAPDTLALAEGFVQIAPLGPVAVRGLPTPIEVYELTGASAVRSRLQATATRGLTRFVGRDSEMEQLGRVLDQARQGRGQVLAIVGEPGVGKSRFVWEVAHSYRAQDWLILAAGSVSYGKATPYLPVVELLRGYFQVGDRDEPGAIREKVTGKLLTLDRAMEPMLPALFTLLDVPVEDSGWQTLYPSQRRQRTLDAVKRLLLRESQVQPLLVVFEDLHWIDSETQAFLDGLVDSLPTARLLLFVNYRPEYAHRWGSKTYYTQLRLDALPPESVEAFLNALLGADSRLASLKRVLSAHTEGNPFFLEETARTLVETGILTGERGSYRLAKALDAMRVPATVQAVLAARIDRLPAEEKRLLQTAAVIGKDVPHALLVAVTEVSHPDLTQWLSELIATEFLYEAPVGPDVAYTFKHALTHEVAYGSLLRATRVEYHARIARAIVEQFPSIADIQPELVAHHYTEAALAEPAVVYWLRAGRRARARSADTEAVRSLTRGLQLLTDLPTSLERDRQELDFLFELGPSLLMTRGYAAEETADVFRRTKRLCEHLGDVGRLPRAFPGLASFYLVRGDIASAREIAREHVAAAAATADRELEGAAQTMAGITAFCGGEPADARHHFDTAMALFGTDLDGITAKPSTSDLKVTTLSWLAPTLWILGFHDAALAVSKTALHRARELAHPFTLAFAFYFAALLHEFRRDFDQLATHANALVAVAREYSYPLILAAGSIWRGWARFHAGYHEDGLREIREGLEAYTATGAAQKRTYWLGLIARACLTVGNNEGARVALAEALDLTNTQGVRFFLAELHRLRGNLLLQAKPADDWEAATEFQHAVEVARSQQAKTWELRGAASLARLRQRQDRQDEARAILAPIYASFTQGFDTVDLRDAKTLLDELTSASK